MAKKKKKNIFIFGFACRYPVFPTPFVGKEYYFPN